MPSPFPGMDPYLENPSWFPNLHDCLIQVLKGQIQPQLPANYHAISRRRTWIEQVADPREPDVAVVDVHPQFQASSIAKARHVAEVASPLVIHVPRVRVTENYLEVYVLTGKNRRKLVTSIEVLSPSNKAPSGGRKKYRRKQAEMLESRVNLIEIDLLRAGRHTTSVPINHLLAKGAHTPYHVCIRPAWQPDEYLVHPCPLRNSLPTINVPLGRTDPDVSLDLQAAFHEAYRLGDYAKVVDYHATPPPPPFDDDDLCWVRERVAATPDLIA